MSEKTLDGYALALGDLVTVELLVTDETPTGRTRPASVFGRVKSATTTALVITGPVPQPGLVRIPWHAIASITDAPVPHPADS